MGNYISCTLSTNPRCKHSSWIKVILPSGEIRQIDGPVNAADLMFENPNHFLVNSRSLQIGRRFSALNADEELEMGNVYVLFSMTRLNSFVTAVDMGVLMMTANSAAKRASGGRRVSPVVNNLQGSEETFPKLKLDDIEDLSVLEFKNRLSVCRARKPSLETIKE
ncbi:hypothetical protein NE237_020548 [Protea cynaroides]|uniref:Uncharacterized protein n=1 Tax=Protea cynaroides TaxID=273540 RepID=A0A9Q0H9B2_9MAGN|nr:hypothetical protein NE237_020548 [Protea cynaroides]